MLGWRFYLPVHERQTDNHRKKARRIDVICDADAQRADHDAADEWAAKGGDLAPGDVERVGRGELFRRYERWNHRGARWRIEDAHRAGEKRDGVDVPHLDLP